MYAIKVEISDLKASEFAFDRQKTMYGGKHIARDDTIFVFASENEGGPGLIARGIVTAAKAIPKKPGILRQTPLVSIAVRRVALARRRLGRSELKPFADWDERPARDRAQLQVLSPGDEQDRRHLGSGGRLSRWLLLAGCA